jgi:hypothetical protein
MSRVLEIHDLEFDGDRLLVSALVEDAVLVRGQTEFDPPEWGPAVCRGSMHMDQEMLIPATDSELRDMVGENVEDWAPIDWSDTDE